jgi:hypothetical protein
MQVHLLHKSSLIRKIVNTLWKNNQIEKVSRFNLIQFVWTRDVQYQSTSVPLVEEMDLKTLSKVLKEKRNTTAAQSYLPSIHIVDYTQLRNSTQDSLIEPYLQPFITAMFCIYPILVPRNKVSHLNSLEFLLSDAPASTPNEPFSLEKDTFLSFLSNKSSTLNRNTMLHYRIELIKDTRTINPTQITKFWKVLNSQLAELKTL